MILRTLGSEGSGRGACWVWRLGVDLGFRAQGLRFSLQTQRPAADQRVGRASFFYEVLWLQRHEIDGASGILGSRPSALPSM